MSNFKINQVENRIRIEGSKYLYFGFNSWNYDDIIKINPSKELKKKIHIFLTRFSDMNSKNNLIRSLDYISKNFKNYKVIFHIPYSCKKVYDLLKTVISQYQSIGYIKNLKYEIYVEKNGPKFLISSENGYELIVKYNEDHVLTSININYTYIETDMNHIE